MILHTGLFVRSLKTSLEFYCDKLGFSLIEEARLEGPMVRFLSNECYAAMRIALLRVCPIGAMIELMEVQPGSGLTNATFLPAPHAGGLAILVEDLAGYIEELREKGVHPATETFHVTLPRGGDCSLVLYRDPDGHLLEFLEMHV